MLSVKEMKLIEVVEQLHELPESTFICARRPWTRYAESKLVPFTEDLRVPQEVLAEGFDYFLEVSTAREILEGFLEKDPSLERITEFLIYYAEYDAFPDWAESV